MGNPNAQAIREAIIYRLKNNSQMRRMKVKVEVTDTGDVSLSGEVHGEWSKRLAEDLTLMIGGVRGVSNELQVNPPAPRLRRR